MFILNANNAMLIVYAVFMAVIFLLVLFIVIGKALDKKKEQKAAMEKANDLNLEEGILFREKVAIAMSLHLYYGVHDEESDIITFKNIHSKYSPWSSKIFGIQ